MFFEYMPNNSKINQSLVNGKIEGYICFKIHHRNSKLDKPYANNWDSILLFYYS